MAKALKWRDSDAAAERTVIIRMLDKQPDVSVRQLERGAKKYARTAARAATRGDHQHPDPDQLEGRAYIHEVSETRIGQVESFSHQYETDLESEIAGLKSRRGMLQPRLQEAEAAAAKAREQLDSVPEDQSPGKVAYFAVLALLAVVEYPTIAAAVQTFPFDAVTRFIIAVGFSVLLALAAHIIGKNVRRLIEEVSRDERRKPELVPQIVLLTLFVVAVVATMAFLALSRGASFATIAELSGDTFDESEVAGGLFLAAQLTLFTIALYLALQRAEGDRARALGRKLREAEKEVEEVMKELKPIEEQISQRELRLAKLDEATGLWVTRERERCEDVVVMHDREYEKAEHSLVGRVGGGIGVKVIERVSRRPPPAPPSKAAAPAEDTDGGSDGSQS